MLRRCCEDVLGWLGPGGFGGGRNQRVAAIHCKAGKVAYSCNPCGQNPCCSCKL